VTIRLIIDRLLHNRYALFTVYATQNYRYSNHYI